MSSATSPARIPLALEGEVFWQDLIRECKQHTAAVNDTLSRSGFASDHFLDCAHNSGLQMWKSSHPSTDVKLTIRYYSWGPVLSGIISGRQNEKFAFTAQELEIPIARDLDGSIVAIFDEGRSFSAHDLACYLTQTFRRCYPEVSLPCNC